MSDNWESTDHNTYINMNFTETREAINFTTDYGAGYQIEKDTILEKNAQELETGDNWVQNDTDIRQFDFVVNGKNPERKFIRIDGLECISGSCTLEEIDEVDVIEDTRRRWSDPANWDGGTLPIEGDDVTIPSGKNFYLDLEETPILNTLTIHGRLNFIQEEKNIHLRVKRIFIRGGELIIGTEEEPFNTTALITLFGNMDE